MKRILNELCAKYTLADEVKAQGIYPYYRPISSGQDPLVTMADGSKVLMFGSNSYLGLSDDPRLKECGKLALVFGTEGDGLSDSTLAACDFQVRIPMSHGVDSLNVAASSAVAFWELRRP